MWSNQLESTRCSYYDFSEEHRHGQGQWFQRMALSLAISLRKSLICYENPLEITKYMWSNQLESTRCSYYDFSEEHRHGQGQWFQRMALSTVIP